jgi:hypothetical protein
MPLNTLNKAVSYAEMKPGEWCIDDMPVDGGPRKGANKVAVMCPVCKLRTHLNELHHVSASGVVTASVMCPRMSCGDGVARCTWHEFVTLLNWDGGAL